MDDKGVMISIEEYRISFRKSLESIYDANEIDNILKLIVKSYSPCKIKHGGLGAFYVKLRINL